MGLIVCLIGTDGSGKSTLAREVAKRVNGKIVYFGWKPFLPTTKLISWLFKKRDYKIAESMNKQQKRFSLIQEIMLFYYYIEYLMRYIFQVRFKSGVVVLDRHFYDMYAHYDYASRSKLFKGLMKIFPSPNFTFFLDVDVLEAKKRKPEMDVSLLKLHRVRYLKLYELLGLKKIDTSRKIVECVNSIVGEVER